MTTSPLLGFLTFGTLALFGWLAWALSYKHPALTGNPVMVRRARRAGVLLPMLGVVMGYGAFALDDRVAAATLFEVMAEGSVGLAPGTPAPARRFDFNVAHPGVEHDLLVAPVSKMFETPTSAVDISISLEGAAGERLIPERIERFSIVGGSRRKTDWEGKTFRFTPRGAGPHTVRVIPMTVGIPGIHIRVGDPLKQDGQRIPGY